MNDKVQDLASQLAVRAIELRHLAEALSRGEEWASFNSNAKHHGTRWAIGVELRDIQHLCFSIDEEWTD